MAVGCKAVGDAASVGGIGLAVTADIEGMGVFVGWVVDGTKVAVACGLAGNNVFVKAIVGGIGLAVA